MTELQKRLACKTKRQYRAWLLEHESHTSIRNQLDHVQHAIQWSALVAVGEEKEDKGVTRARILREMQWEAEIIHDLEAELERENKRKADAVDDCTADQEESRTA